MIRLGKRKVGLTWHFLTERLRTGKYRANTKNFKKVIHLFIMYQWTKKRNRLAAAVMNARLVTILKYHRNRILEINIKIHEIGEYSKVNFDVHIDTIINS